MAEQVQAAKSAETFEYELLEGDPAHIRTVVATPTPAGLRIDPASLKLKHRIGRGPFGDVWLANHHQSADDFDEHHEVVVKMLHSLGEECIRKLLDRFEAEYFMLKRFRYVCWLHGVSIIDGKICIAMKLYEGSVGERMAQLKGGKLQLSDVLRYGIDMAKGILELHSAGLLLLNLKPSNILFNGNNQVVLGDFGIPYLLRGFPPSNSEMVVRLGTPNYMAPEQWEPSVRGPVSFETDAWGFGCCILEMLTGVQPWFGSSIRDMYQSVVINQQKPCIPSGLPLAVEKVIHRCFEYDLRNRPSIADILHAFESSRKVVDSHGGYLGLGSTSTLERSFLSDRGTWYLLKDQIQVGDTVRSRKPTYACKPCSRVISEGTVVGLKTDGDRDSYVLVRTPGVQNPLRVQASTVERVTFGLAPGDWVQLKDKNKEHSHVGLLHSIQRDGSAAAVGFVGLETLWRGHASDLQVSRAYGVGQFVRVKADILVPRFQWPRKTGGLWATGRIAQILPNGCLVVKFPGRLVFGDETNSFLADPDEVELVSFDTCPGVLEKYQHIEDFHWTVRPLAIAFGVFTAMKLGLVVGQHVRTRLTKAQRKRGGDPQDGAGGGSTAWLPSPVANILFKEAVPPATAR